MPADNSYLYTYNGFLWTGFQLRVVCCNKESIFKSQKGKIAVEKSFDILFTFSRFAAILKVPRDPIMQRGLNSPAQIPGGERSLFLRIKFRSSGMRLSFV